MNLFEGVKFKGIWRPYQKRVLQELKSHMLDKKLHVVAAPGSGKTILGLQAILELGKKTLILAPTVTIREQWMNRFETFFLDDNSKLDDYITSDIKSSKKITVVTYQALHAAYNKMHIKNNNNVLEDYSGINIIQILKVIETIVLDEAHHLRQEWWKSLTEVIKCLGKPSIIALTATPPYDVSPYEWDRYQQLCGKIDAEIMVPELVYENNLCPHQDFVYFNYPTEEELHTIEDFKKNVKNLVNELIEDDKLINLIKNHPFILIPEEYMDEILKAPEFYTNLLVFLKHVNEPISKKAVKILGHQSKIPSLTIKRLENFFNHLLYHDILSLSKYEETIQNIKKKLYKAGCIEQRKVSLITHEKLNKLLITSAGKLNSIKEIVKQELSNLGDNLKLVILTDFIRKEMLPKSSNDKVVVNQIGVVPIFDTLREENIPKCRLGVVSGSLIILPSNVITVLNQLLTEKGIQDKNVRVKPLPIGGYFELELAGESNKQKVDLISALFSKGEINVLIGTKSLLGEGWDEPSINTLIMASFVGSYMLSNQMRGRAIRIDNNDPNKTANIWHLVCVENNAWYQTNIIKALGEEVNHRLLYGSESLISEDYETLNRRFKSFVGVSNAENVIENGLDRLSIIKPPYNEENIDRINQEMVKIAKDRDALRKKWRTVLKGGFNQSQMIEEITTDKEIIPKKFIYFDSIMFLLIQSLFSLLMLIPLLLHQFYSISFLFGTIILFSIPQIVRAVLLLVRFGSLKGSIKGIGKTVLDVLMELDYIKSNALLKVVKKNRYEISCYLQNATNYEKNLFNDCLEEIVQPINNPRYLIERKGLIGFFHTKDYVAVPKIIGRNKESANSYADKWSKYVSPCHLIYTRDIYGRKKLLQARVKSLSYQSLSRIERKRVFKNKWQ